MIFIKTENGPVLYYFHKTALTYQFKAENIDIPQSYVFQSNVENARENLDNIKLKAVSFKFTLRRGVDY